ncbi:MAG: autotransporter outer membrane beta-barrel domain-containing protein [Endomicrobia bacterium]|nr:autotransporter outer membrane beta-barrel domain-containing protein [Endomicrobiia bacterium]MCL2506561.1 autotransporter outer membrane beta-barrel domain-containing protein [Endomicrobiia bacterium]MCL2506602.1 autotransporter outer membrane beta-barrel domain-containing protein [Endomicrobiia bacterium]
MRKLQITNDKLRINGRSFFVGIVKSIVDATKQSKLAGIIALIAITFIFSVSQAQAVENAFSLSALNSAVLKSGTNSINKRLGDLRRTKEEVTSAVWMRGYYNELSKYGGLELDANISGVEAGVDFRVLKDSPNRIYAGVLTGYIGAENFDKINNIKSGAPVIGLYETWLNPDGWFIDAVARYFFYNAQNVLSGQKTDFGMFAASIEGGKEFKFLTNSSDFFMVEPKLKGTFGHIQGRTFNYLEYDASHTLIFRPAVFAGYSATLKNGAIVEPYVEGGYSQDLSSDMKISGYGSRGISGGSFDIGGGFNAIITKILSIYTYAGYEKGDKIENLSVNAGFRIALTGARCCGCVKNKCENCKCGQSCKNKKADESTDSAGSGSVSESPLTGNETSVETSENSTNFASADMSDDLKNALSGDSGGATQDFSEETLSDYKDMVNINTEIEGVVSSHPVHFAFDKYEIMTEDEYYLKDLADKIDKSGKNYEINGYTDRIGDAEYNQALSEHRAKTVYDELIRFGVSPDKLIYKGFGFANPVNTDDTLEADAENRRVEIKAVQ